MNTEQQYEAVIFRIIDPYGYYDAKTIVIINIIIEPVDSDALKTYTNTEKTRLYDLKHKNALKI